MRAPVCCLQGVITDGCVGGISSTSAWLCPDSCPQVLLDKLRLCFQQVTRRCRAHREALRRRKRWRRISKNKLLCEVHGTAVSSSKRCGQLTGLCHAIGGLNPTSLPSAPLLALTTTGGRNTLLVFCQRRKSRVGARDLVLCRRRADAGFLLTQRHVKLRTASTRRQRTAPDPTFWRLTGH